jgi:hypothetical protein
MSLFSDDRSRSGLGHIGFALGSNCSSSIDVDAFFNAHSGLKEAGVDAASAAEGACALLGADMAAVTAYMAVLARVAEDVSMAAAAEHDSAQPWGHRPRRASDNVHAVFSSAWLAPLCLMF